MGLGVGEYVREVETRFLELEGRGFALSAQDVGRVMAWYWDGVPLRTVLAALDEADRRRRAELKAERLTLGRIARSVEAAMKRRGERVASPVATYAAEPGDPWRLLDLALGANAAAEFARAALSQAKASGQDVWQAAEGVDRLVVERLEAELSALEREAILASMPAPEASASEEARAERQAFLFARALRARHQVPELVGVLLGGGR